MEQEVRSLWSFDRVELDEATRELRVAGELVKVEPKAFSLMLVLLRHAGEVVTNEEILNAVWPGRMVGPQAIGNLVSKVRQALGDEDNEIIKTVTKAGYRLAAKVTRRAVAEAPSSGTEVRHPGDVVRGREHWYLVSSFGKGGFGDVWLAQHQKTREQRVFKFCDNEHLYTLKREVTIFRLLNEAVGDGDYVRILEWNFDQEPFFIESEVAGLNLRSWAEQKGGLRQIPLGTRLEVLIRVAEAVAAAHSVGVLHKDLKPENILVEDSGDLKVKLADFGAARVLNAARLSELGITQLGFTQTVASTDTSGTLFYMAPELLQASAAMPSLQSDIYAMGVVLYQLLAGDFGKPLAPGWESDIDDELLRQDIADATQGNASRRLQSAMALVERLRNLASRRAALEVEKTDRVRLAAAQKALEQDRARRPWLIAATLALTVGLAVSSYFYFAEKKQKQVAEAYGTFVNSDIVKAADALQGGDPKISLKAAVSNAMPRIQERFGRDPEIELAVSQNLSTTLETLHDFKAAAALRQREITISNGLGGPRGRRSLELKVALERDLIALGDEPGARKVAAEIKPQIEPLPKSDPLVIDSQYADAQIASQFDPPSDKTVKMFQDLLVAAQAAKVPPDKMSRIQQSYLVELENQEKWPELETAARTLAVQFTALFGPAGPRTLFAHVYLGKALLAEHKLPEAEKELMPAYQKLTTLFGPDHGDTLRAAEGLSQLYYQQGRWTEAVILDKQIHAGEVAEGGKDTTWSIEKLGWIARDLGHAGNLVEAEQVSQEAVGDSRRVFGAESIMYAENLVIRAQILIDLKKWGEAKASVEELAGLPAASTGDDNNWAGRLLYLQAQLALEDKDLNLARQETQQALDGMTAAVGADDMDTRLVGELMRSLPSS